MELRPNRRKSNPAPLAPAIVPTIVPREKFRFCDSLLGAVVAVVVVVVVTVVVVVVVAVVVVRTTDTNNKNRISKSVKYALVTTCSKILKCGQFCYIPSSH
jgi:heme/copper-type cytochrome/quinol oxidase subunit 2